MREFHARRLAEAAIMTSVLLLSPALSYAKKNAKTGKLLPPEVLAAKSVYLDCQLPVLDTPRLVTEHIKQWGRFRVEKSPENADLVLYIQYIQGYTAVLFVRDRTYHKVFWSTSAEGGTIPGRCIRLIDLFHERIDQDEARLRQAPPSAQQP